MSKRNRVGYCPNCKQNVLLVRNRCIHCHTQISLKSYKSLQVENQKPHNSNINSDIKVRADETSEPKYCSYCNELLLNELAKFCPHCGSRV